MSVSVEKKPFGVTKDGEAVSAYCIKKMKRWPWRSWVRRGDPLRFGCIMAARGRTQSLAMIRFGIRGKRRLSRRVHWTRRQPYRRRGFTLNRERLSARRNDGENHLHGGVRGTLINMYGLRKCCRTAYGFHARIAGWGKRGIPARCAPP